MTLFQSEYLSSLNSDDLYDPKLPLVKSAALGGTIIMWKTELVISVYSSSFLPIIFSPLGHLLTGNIAVYLPAQGKEKEFLEEMAKLNACVDNLKEKYSVAVFYLRGDVNVNSKNTKRISFLDQFSNEQDLTSVPITHPTSHHLLGNG